jgi:thioredoxin 2
LGRGSEDLASVDIDPARDHGQLVLRTCPSCGGTNRIPAAHLTDTGRCGRCKTALPPVAAPIDITDAATFDDIIGNAKAPILVDFWAAWCGPCKMVAPEVARAASELAGRAIVLKVDTERLPALAARYKVQSIPNFAVFRDGTMVRQQPGAMGHSALERLVAV